MSEFPATSSSKGSLQIFFWSQLSNDASPVSSSSAEEPTPALGHGAGEAGQHRVMADSGTPSERSDQNWANLTTEYCGIVWQWPTARYTGWRAGDGQLIDSSEAQQFWSTDGGSAV